MTTDKIIAANSRKFEMWKTQLEEHFDRTISLQQISDEENTRIFYQTNQLLMDIARNFFTYGKFKDTFDTSKCLPHVFGQHLMLVSLKMDLDFHWGLQQDKFYMESYITHPQNIRYMTDDFWQMFSELQSLGKFEYMNGSRLNAKDRPFFENKTSTIFQVIRDFMLYQVEAKNGINHRLPPSMDLGYFAITWEANIPFEELLDKTCKSFKLLYIINYKLWKISDLHKSKGKDQ